MVEVCRIVPAPLALLPKPDIHIPDLAVCGKEPQVLLRYAEFIRRFGRCQERSPGHVSPPLAGARRSVKKPSAATMALPRAVAIAGAVSVIGRLE